MASNYDDYDSDSIITPTEKKNETKRIYKLYIL